MRAYVHLSAGYLRLAIDLCEHDSAIVHARGFTQGAGLVQGVRGWQFYAMEYLKHTVTHGDHTTLVRLLCAFADRQMVKAPLL
jgi:hypothetical protein